MVVTLRDWIMREHWALNKIDEAVFTANVYSDWDEFEFIDIEYMKERKQKYDKAISMKEEGEKELTEARKEIKKYLLDILENY